MGRNWKATLNLSFLCMGVAVGPAAWAVDGVIEINQARADAGGVTPGDQPGLPVTLSVSGSYRLTGPLTDQLFGPAIEVTANHVSLDLGGFTIRCVGQGIITRCTDGAGIDGASEDNVHVFHGTVRGFGESGIDLGDEARVENVHAFDNGDHGIEVGNGSVVAGCTAYDNSLAGFSVGNGATVHHSTARENSGQGFRVGAGSTVSNCAARDNAGDGFLVSLGSNVSFCAATGNGGDGFDLGLIGGSSLVSGGLATNNVSSGNTGLGLRMDSPWGYRVNVLNANNGGNANPQVNGGVNLGSNVCGDDIFCP